MIRSPNGKKRTRRGGSPPRHLEPSSSDFPWSRQQSNNHSDSTILADSTRARDTAILSPSQRKKPHEDTTQRKKKPPEDTVVDLLSSESEDEWEKKPPGDTVVDLLSPSESEDEWDEAECLEAVKENVENRKRSSAKKRTTAQPAGGIAPGATWYSERHEESDHYAPPTPLPFSPSQKTIDEIQANYLSEKAGS